MDLSLVQSPLPAGEGEDARVLCETEEEGWCKVLPLEWCKKCSVGWWDMRQEKGREGGDGEEQALLGNENERESGSIMGVEEEEGGGQEERFENFWPGIGRWQFGVVMEDAVIEFPAGERWHQSTRGDSALQ